MMIPYRRTALAIAATLFAGLSSAQTSPEPDALAAAPVSAEARPGTIGAADSVEAPNAATEVLDTVPVNPTEQAQAPDAVRKSSSRLIEEIIVTAQKREENLKDVPISISAFGADQLDARGVLDSGDLPKITPGLNITTQVGFTSTFLRGVGSDAFILGDPSVVTYVDGVYFPFALGQVQDFGSIERIEVLKGPQGTLFGRNALGGAIKIETRNPALDKPEVSLQTIVGSRDTFKSRAYVSVPLLDSLAISAAGLYNKSDNIVSGTVGAGAQQREVGKDQSDAYRLKAFWKPSDWLDFTISHYHLTQDAAATFAVNTSPSLIGRTALIQPQDPRHGANSDVPFYQNLNKTTLAQVHATAPWFDLKLIGSDQYVENNQNYDFDGSPVPIAKFESTPGFADVQTGEFQILSNAESPGSDWLEWILGVYYFKSHAGFNPGFLSVASVDLQRGELAGASLPQGLTDVLRGLLGNSPVPVGVALNFVGLLDTKSTAYFSQATVHLTDWAAVTLGARYQDEDRIVDRSSAGVRNTDGSTTLIPGQNYSGYDDPRYRDTTKSFDPKVSINFRPEWNWLGQSPLLYINYQTATTSSTFNTVNIYDAPEKVDGSEITAYEVGLKTRLLDGLWDLNVAAFNYKIDSPQVQIVSLIAGGAVRFENAGGERIRGVDFDSVIQVWPSLTDGNLILTIGGAYLDTEYTSYPGGSGFDETTGIFNSNNDFSGNEVVRSPTFSGTVGLLQTFPTDYGPIEVGADYYYNSGFYYLAQNTPNVEEKAYGTLGANLSFLYEAWGLRVTVFGRNLLDESYNLSRFVTDFGTNDTRAPLATYGLRLNYDF